MESKPETNDGAWGGEGPQSNAAPSPAVVCEFEHDPQQCSFPMCECGGMQWPAGIPESDKAPIVRNAPLEIPEDGSIPPFLRRVKLTGKPREDGPVIAAAQAAEMIDQVFINAIEQQADNTCEFSGFDLASGPDQTAVSLVSSDEDGNVTVTHIPASEFYQVIPVEEGAALCASFADAHAEKSKRQPKRDRAAYMRDYRWKRKAEGRACQ